MSGRMRAKVLCIDSRAVYKLIEGWGLYCASKACVSMFLQTVHLENPDIKILLYEPGVVDICRKKSDRLMRLYSDR